MITWQDISDKLKIADVDGGCIGGTNENGTFVPQTIPEIPEAPEGFKMQSWSWLNASTVRVNYAVPEPLPEPAPEPEGGD